MNKRYDYAVLEREYVTSDISLRELARKHGISNHSVVMVQARQNDWNRKREEFKAKASTRTVELLANNEAMRRNRMLEVQDNAIEAIDEAITTMRQQMKETRLVMRNGEYVEEPLVIVRAQDAAILIDRLNVLFGRPSTITEERSLGLSLSGAGLTPDALKGIIDATRGLTDEGGAAVSPFPRIDRAREN